MCAQLCLLMNLNSQFGALALLASHKLSKKTDTLKISYK